MPGQRLHTHFSVYNQKLFLQPNWQAVFKCFIIQLTSRGVIKHSSKWKSFVFKQLQSRICSKGYLTVLRAPFSCYTGHLTLERELRI